jgi:Mor family transcriptional regulator
MAALEILAEILRDQLKAHGLDDLTDNIVERFAEEVGGERVYVSRKPRSAWSERNRQLRAEFNGRNHDELARKYRVSKRRVYQLLGD